jgi:hypothetical protein
MRRESGDARQRGTAGDMAPGVRNEISAGHFEGPVIQAQSVGSIVTQVRPAGRDYLFAALAAAVLVALGVFLGAGGGSVVTGTRIRWPAAAGCGGLALLLGITLVARRRREIRALQVDIPARNLNDIADTLARTLAARYAQEEEHGRITDPMSLPVRWAPARLGLGDHHEGLTDDGDVSPLAGEFGEVADCYARLPRGRLLILGAPGAGKSALVVHLARELLNGRQRGEAAPVVLPLASWSPKAQPSLWWWAAGALAEAHPDALTSPLAPRRTVAHRLLTSGLVLPVLDGFDELPARERVNALVQLREGLRGTLRLVLTSRSGAFTAAVEEGDVRLPGMAAVELRSLDAGSVHAYLPRSARPRGGSGPRGTGAGTKWDPVLARLADQHDTAAEVRLLRDVLSTPLMVSLSRAAYSDTAADPAELLAAGRFRTAGALKRHLFGAFVTAAYADDAAEPASRARWTGERARRWLGELALRQTESEQPDIAWWRLERMVPRRARLLLSLPLPVLVAVALTVSGLSTTVDIIGVATPMWALGLISGLAAVVTDWYITVDSELPVPQRLGRPVAGAVRAALSRPFPRALVVLGAVALAVLWAVAAAHGVLGITVLSVTGAAVFLGLVALRNAVRRPADPEALGPEALLRADRRATLWLAVVSLPGSRAPLRLHKTLLGFVATLVVMWGGLFQGRDAMSTARWTSTAVVLALGVGVWSCAVSAWGRYGAARFWLAAGGHLPWRLTRFLRDAHRRGVLRQSGGFYRFRHLALQHELAAEARAVRGERSTGREFLPDLRAQERLARRVAFQERALTAVGTAVSVLTAIALLGAGLTAPVPAGPVPSLASACSLLTVPDLRPLLQDPARATGYDDRQVWPWRAPATVSIPPLRDSTSCVFEEQAPFRPDTVITLRVGVTAAEGQLSGADQAEQWVRKANFDKSERRDDVGDSAIVSDADFLTDDPLERDLGRAEIPMGVVRARADNAVVLADVSMEFATVAQVREMAVAVARTVLRNAGLVGPAQAGERTLKELSGAPLARESRFSLYRREAGKPLEGAQWGVGERSKIVMIHPGLYFWMALRLPRGMDCSAGLAALDEAGECVWNTPEGPVRVELKLHACDRYSGCGDRDAFYAGLPGTNPGTWPQHDRATRYRLADSDGVRTASLIRLLRSWWRPLGSDDRSPFDFFLWLRVTAPAGHADLAEKIMNDVFRQQPPDGA